MFTRIIKHEQKRIQRIIDLSAPPETSGPAGFLRLKKKGMNYYCYSEYRCKGEKTQLTYLGTPQSEPVRDYISKRFHKERMKRLQSDLKMLKQLEMDYQEYDAASVVSALPKSYQKIINTAFFNNRYEELLKWAAADYPRNTYPFSDSENYTRDGIRVRSKGECIIYNLLQERGIPFRYECVIKIKDKNGMVKTLFPDFLIKCLDGSYIIIEHLGGLDDMSYALDFGKRCHWLLQEGFILGKNFFVTSDDLHHGTDSQTIASVIDRIEMLFYGY